MVLSKLILKFQNFAEKFADQKLVRVGDKLRYQFNA